MYYALTDCSVGVRVRDRVGLVLTDCSVWVRVGVEVRVRVSAH